MSFKQKTIIKILLIVAKMFCDDPKLAEEIITLATHISVGDWGKS